MKDSLKEIKTSAELKDCLEIIHKSYKKRDEELGLDKSNKKRHSFLSYEELKAMYDKGIKMYGYYFDTTLIGFLALSIMEDEIKIKDIVVSPEYQSKGIGTILLNFVIEVATKNNKKKIILGMIYDNTKLKNWYEKYGFKLTKVVTYPNSTSRIGYMEYIIK